MYDVFDLDSDYGRSPKAWGLTLDQAKALCKRDTAKYFWSRDSGELYAANKFKEAIHVIVPTGG